MKINWLAFSSAAALAFTMGQAHAQELPDVANEVGCNACHKVDEKVVGPAWGWVKHRYQDKSESEFKELVKSQIKDGSGDDKNWADHTGGAPMPPYGDRSSEEQRDELADFIFNLDPIEPPDA